MLEAVRGCNVTGDNRAEGFCIPEVVRLDPSAIVSTLELPARPGTLTELILRLPRYEGELTRGRETVLFDDVMEILTQAEPCALCGAGFEEAKEPSEPCPHGCVDGWLSCQVAIENNQAVDKTGECENCQPCPIHKPANGKGN